MAWARNLVCNQRSAKRTKPCFNRNREKNNSYILRNSNLTGHRLKIKRYITYKTAEMLLNNWRNRISGCCTGIEVGRSRIVIKGRPTMHQEHAHWSNLAAGCGSPMNLKVRVYVVVERGWTKLRRTASRRVFSSSVCIRFRCNTIQQVSTGHEKRHRSVSPDRADTERP